MQIYEDPLDLDLPSQLEATLKGTALEFSNLRNSSENSDPAYISKDTRDISLNNNNNSKTGSALERRKPVHFNRSRSRLSQKQMTSSARQILDNVLSKEIKSKQSSESLTSKNPKESKSNPSTNVSCTSCNNEFVQPHTSTLVSDGCNHSCNKEEAHRNHDSLSSWIPGMYNNICGVTNSCKEVHHTLGILVLFFSCLSGRLI